MILKNLSDEQRTSIEECLSDPDPLVNRLRGIYQIGPDGKFGTRQFDKVPTIQLAAAEKIETLEKDIKALAKYLRMIDRFGAPANFSDEVTVLMDKYGKPPEPT